jgi:hypothetical protein
MRAMRPGNRTKFESVKPLHPCRLATIFHEHAGPDWHCKIERNRKCNVFEEELGAEGRCKAWPRCEKERSGRIRIAEELQDTESHRKVGK